MADFNKFYPKILNFEGGYQDDPADTGNYYNHKLIGTNMGVSAPTLAAYLKREPTVEDMKALTKDSVIKICKENYWDRWKADQINNQSIAEICVDWVWASGVPGITLVQKILNVDPDGHVGKITINAMNTYGNDAALHAIIQQTRLNYVDYICQLNPTNNKFKKGWKNRINAFTFEP